MAVLPATPANIFTIRERFAERDNPPVLPEDDDVAAYFDPSLGNVALMDGGRFGQAHWSEVNDYSTVVWLLPETMTARQMGRLMLGLFDALWEQFPASQTRIVDGRSPAAGTADYGQAKADTIADLIMGRGTERPKVDPVLNSANVRTGTRISMPLARARTLLRDSLYDR